MRHDLKWFMETLRNLIWEYFDLTPNKEQEVKTATNGAGDTAKPGEEAHDDANQNSADGPSKQQTAQAKMRSRRQPPGSSQFSMDVNDPRYRVWPIEDEENLWFSTMNMDVDGYYVEFR